MSFSKLQKAFQEVCLKHRNIRREIPAGAILKRDGSGVRSLLADRFLPGTGLPFKGAGRGGNGWIGPCGRARERTPLRP